MMSLRINFLDCYLSDMFKKIPLLIIIIIGLTVDAFCLSNAADVDINKIPLVGGESRLMVDAGHFDNENSALQLKFKLSSTLKQPIIIEHETNGKDYVVKIGPIDDPIVASNIEQMINPLREPSFMPAIPLKYKHSPATIENTSSYEGHFNTPNASEFTPTLSSPADHGDKKLWNLRNADVRAVINEVSRITGKNFIIDPRVQGKISIISGSPISNKELYQVFLSMLQISGYATVPTGSIIKIIPNIDAKTSIDSVGHFPEGDEMLVEVVPVHYVPAEQLVPILRPLMPQWSNVSAYSPSNMLILSGRANNIRHMVKIIKQVDTSSSNGIDMISLKHALAMDVVNTLKDLTKPMPGSSGMHQPNLAVDDRSNAILLSGTRTERLRIRLLIAQLDKDTAYGSNGNTKVVYLHYLRAEDLVPILAGVAQANFSGTVGTTIGTITKPTIDSTDPASNFANNSGVMAPINPFKSEPNGEKLTSVASPNTAASASQTQGSTKPSVQIIAEPNTNSIILNAPNSLVRILRTVISQLDIQPAQLLIEALVAEIDENDVNSLGIEWGSNQQSGDPKSFRPGFAIINSRTSISDFQAQLYALVRARKANILSTPSVVVLDNRQAKILVGRQLSVATTSYPNNGGGTTTASPYQTFDRVNVALHLYVRPQITRGEGIQLQIDQGNDTLDPSSLTNSDNPIFKISSIVTSVQVESGDVVVLGGLIQDSLARDENDLGILSEIPGLGKLFQHNTRIRDKRVLMVFIKPQILHNPNDAIQVTGEKYRDLREYQLKWLRDQDYRKYNDQVILPALKHADLPLPFSNAPPHKTTVETKHYG